MLEIAAVTEWDGLGRHLDVTQAAGADGSEDERFGVKCTEISVIWEECDHALHHSLEVLSACLLYDGGDDVLALNVKIL